jgi:hypothetical protein
LNAFWYMCVPSTSSTRTRPAAEPEGGKEGRDEMYYTIGEPGLMC